MEYFNEMSLTCQDNVHVGWHVNKIVIFNGQMIKSHQTENVNNLFVTF